MSGVNWPHRPPGEVENPLRFDLDEIEPLLHPAIDFAGEKIAFAIGCGNSGKASTDVLPVDKT